MTASFVALGAVADIQLGKMLSPNAKTGGESWPYLRNANVQWGRLELGDMSEMDFSDDERVKFSIERGDLLVCEGGEPGRCAVVDRDLPGVYFQKALMRVRPNSRQIDVRYLQHFMAYAAGRGAFMKGGNQATIAHFPAVRLSAFEVPLLPIIEQRRIADVLDKADAIRRKRKQAIDLTGDLIRSTFLDMFGDPVTNPKGWPVVSLASQADVRSGEAKGKRYDDQELVSRPYMRVANVQDGYLMLDEVKHIEVTAQESESYRLEVGDVLLTEGGDPDKLGRGAVWRGEVDECIHQNHVFRVRVGASAIPDFVNSQLGSDRGKRYFLRAAKQTTGIASINMGQLRAFPLLLPPMSLQRAFASAAAQARAIAGCMHRAQSAEDELFSSVSRTVFAA